MWVYKMAVKVKLLSFDGEDPVGWIMHTKTYLKIQGASEEVKVRLEKLGYLHKNGMLQYEKLYLYCRLRSSSCFYVSMVPEKKSCTLHSMVVIKVHIVKWILLQLMSLFWGLFLYNKDILLRVFTMEEI
ncbi:unnamed protein product [Vicia faba]|uniref:Uncharacterized protein n=1 Tax=Vicia faba TaxID=3906 RepID=A0AAV0YJ16_VICFA|nr:unnamed protein product [Vicia faba]